MTHMEQSSVDIARGLLYSTSHLRCYTGDMYEFILLYCFRDVGLIT